MLEMMERQRLLDEVAVALQRVDHELRVVKTTQLELGVALKDLENARAALEHAFSRLLEAEPSPVEMNALMLDTGIAES
jgi:hypothetical protein